MTEARSIPLPERAAIPSEAKLGELVEQREYLIDGELRHWSGPMKDAISAIELDGDDGPSAVVVGRFPKMGADDSMAALDAAVRAFDRGRGEWPTASVSERILAVE